MSNKEYEYKFDTVKPPEDRVYDDRVMHYYENHSNEPARPLILALGKHITDRVLYKLPWLPKVGKELTVNDPEYWGLASIVTDEMAEVALKMKVHKGMKLKEIMKATGKSAAYLEPLLKEMANVGLVEFNWENPEHEKQYMLPMFVPGSAEFFNMKWDNICEHPQVANFFERMTQLPLEAITPMVPPGGAGIGMHVIPVEKAISMENQSADVEHISHWLDKYDGKYAAGPCSCRYSRAMCGEGCADDPEDWCIGVGDMADYLVETNKGHYITREKVMEILQRAEDNGFVHQITNIGGGNVAVDVARSTKRCGADVLGMFCLESREEMPASEEEIFETEDEGIQINNGWGVKEILAENGKVTGVVLKKCTSVKDADGKFNPQYDENDTQTIECDRIYLSIGQSIEWGNLIDGEAVELGRGNAPQADSLTYQTGQKDIFVGGDVYTGPRFAIDAIAAGREGAESIHRFVHFNASLTVGRNRRDFIMLDKNDILVDSYDNSSRQIPNINKKIDAKSSFKDAHLPLTEEQVKKETARCLGCGASVVDENKCIGCGICTTKCEFDAIHLFRDNPECSTMVNSDDKKKAILPYMIKRNFKIKKAQKAKKD